MIPQDLLSRKHFLALADAALVPIIVLLVGASSFFLGRYSALETCRGHLIHPPGNAELIATPTPATPDFLGGQEQETDSSSNTDNANTQAPSVSAAKTPATADDPHNFVASKNGSIYYLPACSGVKRITPANRVYFATRQEAESAGYTPAANCKGL